MDLYSSQLKLDRAAEHISYLSEFIKNNRPFTYILEANTQTCQCATFAKQDKSICGKISVICGDILHNLRSALDSAYWDIVSPCLASASHGNIQFPFCTKKDMLIETVKNRLAHKVSSTFFDAIMNLKPYRDSGGNYYLYLLHEVNIIDKHRIVTPIGDYTRISSEIVRRQVPSFPKGINNCTFGSCRRDIVWDVTHIDYRGYWKIGCSLLEIEKELDVPVDIVMSIGSLGDRKNLITTINGIFNATKQAIEFMAATSVQ